MQEEEERMRKGNGKNHGVRVVAVPKLRDGAKWPTRADWIARKNKPDDSPDEKMAKLKVAAEERARIKLIEMGLKTSD